MKHIVVDGRKLEFRRLPSAHPREDAPPMLFLHEGLGCIAMWRDFPQQVADVTGCEAVIYSRAGYGQSDAMPLPRTVRYMHDEGLSALPQLIRALELESPILFGHSDGGSIALICAGGTTLALSAAVVMAPHVLVEDITVAGIADAEQAWRTTPLRERLGRYHRDVDTVFRSWNDTWLSPEFRDWNIEPYLPAIGCPLLAIQGEDDEYATMTQIDRIAAAASDVELCKLADCRHSPHKDQPEAVIEAVRGFVDRILDER